MAMSRRGHLGRAAGGALITMLNDTRRVGTGYALGVVPVVHASAISVRHALARALATHNRSPADATFRFLTARATVDGRGRVVRADVTVRLEPTLTKLDSAEVVGLVNPTGLHPLMAVVPGLPNVLLDIFPVSWERWVRVRPGAMPAGIDGWTVRTGIEHADAAAWARSAGKRLPTATELRAAWGTSQFPWGNSPDPSAGLASAPKYDEVPQVALFPPNRAGFFDLGAWLWTWTDEGTLLGGAPGLVPGSPESRPFGLRCAADFLE